MITILCVSYYLLGLGFFSAVYWKAVTPRDTVERVAIWVAVIILAVIWLPLVLVKLGQGIYTRSIRWL